MKIDFLTLEEHLRYIQPANNVHYSWGIYAKSIVLSRTLLTEYLFDQRIFENCVSPMQMKLI